MRLTGGRVHLESKCQEGSMRRVCVQVHVLVERKNLLDGQTHQTETACLFVRELLSFRWEEAPN